MKKSLVTLAFAAAAVFAFGQDAPKADPKPSCPQQKCCCQGCAKKDQATCKAKKDCPKKADCPKAKKS